MFLIQQFEKLLPYAHDLGVKFELRVMSHLLCVYLSLITPDNSLTLEQWDRCYTLLTQMVGDEVCPFNPQIQHVENRAEITLDFYNIHDTVKNLDERLTAELNDLTSEEMKVLIEGDFVQYVTALYNDYINSQRFTDPHDRVYIQRLANEMRLVDCCKHLQAYYKTRNSTHYLTVLLLQLRLVYALGIFSIVATT